MIKIQPIVSVIFFCKKMDGMFQLTEFTLHDDDISYLSWWPVGTIDDGLLLWFTLSILSIECKIRQQTNQASIGWCSARAGRKTWHYLRVIFFV